MPNKEEFKKNIVKARELDETGVQALLEEQLTDIDERKTKLFLYKCKTVASIVLLLLCGAVVVALPIIANLTRMLAIWKGASAPGANWMESLTSLVGVLSILAWSFPAVIPILQIMRPKPKDVIDLDPDTKGE